MKIFLDTANLDEIRKARHIIDGVTTNPSLLAKEGRGFDEIVQEICSLVNGPISLEVVSLDAEGMLAEARILAKIHPNVHVKIPMCWEGIMAVKQLSREGIRTNVTLVFSAGQALLAAKAGATFVSPFVGRLDDISHDGMELIGEIVTIVQNYHFKTEVLVASVRHPLHVKQAALMGAHIATVPLKVLEQMTQHPLTDAGIARFLEDWKKVPHKPFTQVKR